MYRYGGDEFLILLPETTIEQAEEILSRLDAALCPELATALGPVTFSTGIASYAVIHRQTTSSSWRTTVCTNPSGLAKDTPPVTRRSSPPGVVVQCKGRYR